MNNQLSSPAREWKFDLPQPVAIDLNSIERVRPSPRQLLVRLSLHALGVMINLLNRTNFPKGTGHEGQAH